MKSFCRIMLLVGLATLGNAASVYAQPSDRFHRVTTVAQRDLRVTYARDMENRAFHARPALCVEREPSRTGVKGPCRPKLGSRVSRARPLHRPFRSRIAESWSERRAFLDLAERAGAGGARTSAPAEISHVLSRIAIRCGLDAAGHAHGHLEHVVSQDLLLREPVPGDGWPRSYGKRRNDAPPLVPGKSGSRPLNPGLSASRGLL